MPAMCRGGHRPAAEHATGEEGRFCSHGISKDRGQRASGGPHCRSRTGSGTPEGSVESDRARPVSAKTTFRAWPPTVRTQGTRCGWLRKISAIRAPRKNPSAADRGAPGQLVVERGPHTQGPPPAARTRGSWESRPAPASRCISRDLHEHVARGTWHVARGTWHVARGLRPEA